MRLSAKAQMLNGTGRTLPLQLTAVLSGWTPGGMQAPALAKPMPALAPPVVSMGGATLANCDKCGGGGVAAVLCRGEKVLCDGCDGKGQVMYG